MPPKKKVIESDPIARITQNAIKRLARRAGVTRIDRLVYEEIRLRIRNFLKREITAAIVRVNSTKMRTLMVEHVEPSLDVSMYSAEMARYKCRSPKKGESTTALGEIRRLQDSGCLLLPLAAFERVVRDIVMENDRFLRISKDAILLLQYSTEHNMVNLIQSAHTCTQHAGRINLMPRDIALAQNLEGGNSQSSLESSRPSATVPKVDFSKCIKKVLNDIYKDKKITVNALSQLNFIINFFAATLAQNARDLTSLSKRNTVSSQDVQDALYTIMPGELSRHAVTQGNKVLFGKGGYDKEVKNNFSTSLSSDLLKQCIKLHTVKKSVSKGGCSTRVSSNATLYFTAALEYLTAELLEISGNLSDKDITARNIFLAITADDDLDNLITHRLGLGILGSGVVPYIQRRLLRNEPEED